MCISTTPKIFLLERLSEHFGISASHISNLFHTVTGTKLISYITNIRLEEAKKLLRNTDDCIYHIALQVGFSDAGYFNRIFKKEVGISPKTYRNFTKTIQTIFANFDKACLSVQMPILIFPDTIKHCAQKRFAESG